ncbi:PDZ domain-containing protein [Planctomicrobium sp. SH668]|uniref:PDZ domain-containing protein n=1 Tax=Planctomicrobium sp. SH668 TaxID=3448126 RepID=UPI003F5B92DF
MLNFNSQALNESGSAWLNESIDLTAMQQSVLKTSRPSGKSSILRLALLLAGCFVFHPHSLLADETATSKISSLIAQLSTSDFQERVTSQRELAKLVLKQPEVLATAFPTVDEEAQGRIVQLLEGVFLAYSDARGDRAEQILELLANSGSLEASRVLNGNSRLRECRAKLAIERLGGQFCYVHPNDLLFQTPLAPWSGVGFGEPAMLQTILLSEDWKGTKDDLWHFHRLAHHQNLTLYNIRGNSIPTEELFPLSTILVGLKVEERGACLGIQAAPGAGTAAVADIVANSAADLAGIQRNDQILKVGEQEVRNFAHLVEMLTDYRPGDEVTLEISRFGEKMHVPVKLVSWKSVLPKERRYIPAPPSFFGPLGTAQPPVAPLPVPAPSKNFDHLDYN